MCSVKNQHQLTYEYVSFSRTNDLNAHSAITCEPQRMEAGRRTISANFRLKIVNVSIMRE